MNPLPRRTPDACPLPKTPAVDEETIVRQLLRAERIAVVGLSDDRSRPSYGVAAYLISAGLTVVPVNPNYQTALGLRSYPSLTAVPGPIDLVDVFRRADACPGVVREAIAAGAKGIWLQSGIRSAEAKELAAAAGIPFVQDRCLMVDHRYGSP